MYASSSTDLSHTYETTSIRPEGRRSKLRGLIRRLGRRAEEMKDSDTCSQRFDKGYSTDDLSIISMKEAEMFTDEDMAWSRPSSRTSGRSHRRHHRRTDHASSNQDVAEMLDDENSAWVQ